MKIKKILSAFIIGSVIAGSALSASADDIDYSCYKGTWSQKGATHVGLEITYCTDTTMDFTFYWHQFEVDVEDARINGTKVYGEYYELWDDGVDFINYEIKGSITLDLYTNRIEVEWVGYENGEGPSRTNLVLHNDNFVYKTKNTSSNNSSSNSSSSSGSSSSSTSQSGSKGTITVTKNLDIKINGKSVYFSNAKPFIDSAGRTQVPVRFVAEQLGYEVEWEKPSNIDNIPQGGVAIRGDNIPIKWDGETVYRSLFLAIGSNWIGIFDFESSGGSGYGRSHDIYMDTEAMIKNGRTYIPLRYVAELLGYNVVWQ